MSSVQAYKGQYYCSDQSTCAVSHEKCKHKLTEIEAARASVLSCWPVAWMSFKDTCTDYEEKK